MRKHMVNGTPLPALSCGERAPAAGGWVRGCGLSSVRSPLTPTLSLWEGAICAFV